MIKCIYYSRSGEDMNITCIYDRIINGTCTNKELTAFLRNIDEMQFDEESPFEKYYSLKAILRLIEKYKSGKVSINYFNNWINAYYIMIVGGLKKAEKFEINLYSALKWSILDWISKLSFLNEYCNFDDIMIYVKALSTLDKVYREKDDCSAIFSKYNSCDYDVVALTYNSKRRYFIKIFVDTCRYKFDEEYSLPELCELKIQEEGLRGIGYCELQYLP